MATYNLWVTSSVIEQIRSNDQDTLIASMGLQVMNSVGALHMSWPSKNMNLGTHVAGDAMDLYLLFQNVDVPDPTPEFPDGGAIYWNFLLVNAGEGDMPMIVQAATAAATGIASVIRVTGPVGIVVGSAIQGVAALASLLLTGCDGTVASQSWAFTAAQLAGMTSGEMGWNTMQNYPGSQSPLACGAPSSYDVNYTITAKQAVRVPPLAGQPAAEALHVASEAGLSMQIAREVATAQADVVTVQGSQPAAGALVPFGTVLNVVVEIPEQGGGGVSGGGGAGGGGGHERP